MRQPDKIPLRRSVILVLMLVSLVGCGSVRPSELEVLRDRGVELTAEQLESLRHAIAQLPEMPDWVDVRELRVQVSEAGRDSSLSAEAVRSPVRVAPHLCRGVLVSIGMYGADFDRNEWKVSPPREYAVYDPAVEDPCSSARRRDARFWIRGGVGSDDLLDILEVIHSRSVEPTLRSGERILLIEASVAPGSDAIKVTTETAHWQGRTVTFERTESGWSGTVTGGWIASVNGPRPLPDPDAHLTCCAA